MPHGAAAIIGHGFDCDSWAVSHEPFRQSIVPRNSTLLRTGHQTTQLREWAARRPGALPMDTHEDVSAKIRERAIDHDQYLAEFKLD